MPRRSTPFRQIPRRGAESRQPDGNTEGPRACFARYGRWRVSYSEMRYVASVLKCLPGKLRKSSHSNMVQWRHGLHCFKCGQYVAFRRIKQYTFHGFGFFWNNPQWVVRECRLNPCGSGAARGSHAVGPRCDGLNAKSLLSFSRGYVHKCATRLGSAWTRNSFFRRATCVARDRISLLFQV
jgi:hypothetical protein